MRWEYAIVFVAENCRVVLIFRTEASGGVFSLMVVFGMGIGASEAVYRR